MLRIRASFSSPMRGRELNREILKTRTNEELVEIYVSHLVARNRSQRTIRYFRSILKFFISFLGGKHVSEANTYDLDAFLAYLRKKGWKPDSLYTAAVAVKRFLEYLGLYTNITGFELPKRQKKLPRYLEEDEVELLISSAETLRDKLIITLLYTTGLRVSELVTLKKSDVDLQDCTVRVLGKGGKERYVYFPRKIRETLKKYMDSVKGEWLFPSRGGGHIHYTTVERMIRKAAKKAGIKKRVTPHVLRHTFATRSLEKGMDIREIQELLGHSNLNTTQVYAHVSRRRLKRDYERIWGVI